MFPGPPDARSVTPVRLPAPAFALPVACPAPPRPLPRTSLGLSTAGLLVHGVAFGPAVLLWPMAMIIVYDGEGINTVLIVINALCFVVGIGYLLGTRAAWAGLSVRKPSLSIV